MPTCIGNPQRLVVALRAFHWPVRVKRRNSCFPIQSWGMKCDPASLGGGMCLENGWEKLRPEGGDVSEQLWGAGAGDQQQPVGSGWQLIPVQRRCQNTRNHLQRVSTCLTRIKASQRYFNVRVLGLWRADDKSDQTVNKREADLQEAHQQNILSTAWSFLLTQVSVTQHCRNHRVRNDMSLVTALSYCVTRTVTARHLCPQRAASRLSSELMLHCLFKSLQMFVHGHIGTLTQQLSSLVVTRCAFQSLLAVFLIRLNKEVCLPQNTILITTDCSQTQHQ